MSLSYGFRQCDRAEPQDGMIMRVIYIAHATATSERDRTARWNVETLQLHIIELLTQVSSAVEGSRLFRLSCFHVLYLLCNLFM